MAAADLQMCFDGLGERSAMYPLKEVRRELEDTKCFKFQEELEGDISSDMVDV